MGNGSRAPSAGILAVLVAVAVLLSFGTAGVAIATQDDDRGHGNECDGSDGDNSGRSDGVNGSGTENRKDGSDSDDRGDSGTHPRCDGSGEDETPTPSETPTATATPMPTPTATPGDSSTPTPTTVVPPTPTPGETTVPTPTDEATPYDAESEPPREKTPASTVGVPPAPLDLGPSELAETEPRDISASDAVAVSITSLGIVVVVTAVAWKLAVI